MAKDFKDKVHENVVTPFLDGMERHYDNHGERSKKADKVRAKRDSKTPPPIKGRFYPGTFNLSARRDWRSRTKTANDDYKAVMEVVRQHRRQREKDAVRFKSQKSHIKMRIAHAREEVVNEIRQRRLEIETGYQNTLQGTNSIRGSRFRQWRARSEARRDYNAALKALNREGSVRVKTRHRKAAYKAALKAGKTAYREQDLLARHAHEDKAERAKSYKGSVEGGIKAEKKKARENTRKNLRRTGASIYAGLHDAAHHTRAAASGAAEVLSEAKRRREERKPPKPNPAPT